MQNWIADSAAEMHAARLMTLHAAWKMDTEGASAARQEIALIKFYGAKVLHDVVDRALQAHGSLGYSTDLPLEQMYRFARAARLYDGPDEVHRQSVARQILRGYEAPAGRRPERARADAPRGRPRAVRRPARGGDLQRLGGHCWSVALVAGSSPAGVRRHGARRPTRRGGLKVDRFDRDRAFADLRHQVELGPRPAGSSERARARALAARPAPHGRIETVPAAARTSSAGSRAAASRSSSPPTTTPRTSRASSAPTTARAARRRCSRSPARCARRPGGAPPIRFVLFDGEESPDDNADFYSTGLRGSQPYARRHAKRDRGR